VKKPAAADGKPALLSEEQVLKMPEKDYMNAAQLAFFRDRLEKMKQELLANADLTSEHLRESDVVPDPADRATIERSTRSSSAPATASASS
jgi:DnaK suppressor protein